MFENQQPCNAARFVVQLIADDFVFFILLSKVRHRISSSLYSNMNSALRSLVRRFKEIINNLI